MCLPLCAMKLGEAVSRRQMLRSAAIAAAAPVLTSLSAARPLGRRHSFERVIDLTHTLSPSFPTPWKDPLALEQISRLGKDKWNIFRWHLNEHIGTHLDAPLHCTELDSADRIPAENLVGPLVILDISARASETPDTQLALEDIKKWEKAHGHVPDGAIVALNSGWDAHVRNPRKFLGLDESGNYHLPGFSLEAVRFLNEQRDVKGIATDTLNLDAAAAGDFPVHHYWLGQNKWGLENVANLGSLPASGATIVVGSPKIAGSTGGPSRVLALV
ncbi:MAG TPA: cyclase family protein [Patescibacteria group bacterium]|nr:cyclase family protein [Patescibacteria group bacterium]